MTHPLKDWLASRSPRQTMKGLADKIGVHHQTLRRLVNAEDSVQRDLFEKIERATDGDLKAVELYRLYLEQRGGAAASTDMRASA